jgi:hypothetical protein
MKIAAPLFESAQQAARERASPQHFPPPVREMSTVQHRARQPTSTANAAAQKRFREPAHVPRGKARNSSRDRRRSMSRNGDPTCHKARDFSPEVTLVSALS